eukprot:TRINITY_DN10572_c0_g1_i1.p1 TRINITY_DN10572_c0_g1~~TRINITY_DN10572_c0_g1_i1.p1  ORF type:complete len:843 (+),score=178.52 TRINITY_DN10572_c0_g1_i1:37-2565(+)
MDECTWEKQVDEGTASIQWHPNGSTLLVASNTKGVMVQVPIDGSDNWKKYNEDSSGINDIVIDNKGRIATCSNDRYVYTYDLDMNRSLITRFESAVICLSYSLDGMWLASGGSDKIVKLIEIDNPTNCFVLNHKSAVQSISFDPQGTLVAALGSSGLLKIWDISSIDKGNSGIKEVTELNIPMLGYLNNEKLKMEWHPVGSFLAVPSENGVTIVEKPFDDEGSWTTRELEAYSQGTSLYWNTSGNYLISCHMDGTLAIWDYVMEMTIAQKKFDDKITDISFNPEGSSLCLVNDMGEVSLWSDIFDKLSDSPEMDNIFKYLAGPVIDNSTLEESTADDKEPTFEDTFGETQEEMNGSSQPDIVDMNVRRFGQGDIPTLTTTNIHHSTITDNLFDDEYENDDFVIGAANNLEKKKASFKLHANAGPTHLTKRYLVWNNTGCVITEYDEENDKSYLSVKYSNVGKHSNLNITKEGKITCADISDDGIVLVIEQTEIHFQSFKSSSIAYTEWDISSNNEEIDGICLCKDYIISTSSLYIRYFTLGGLQKFITSPSGPVYSIIGDGNKVCIVYLSRYPFQFSCKYTILDLDNQETLVSGNIALSNTNDCSLKWIGFTSNSMLATMDSKGIIRVLVNNSVEGEWNKQWTPVLRSGIDIPESSIWVVSIYGNRLIYVPLKNGSSPSMSPPPIPKNAMLRVPIVVETKEDKFEQDYLLQSITQKYKIKEDIVKNNEDIKVIVDLDKPILLLFQKACEEQLFKRALDLSNCLVLEPSINKAISYSRKNGFTGLAQSIVNQGNQGVSIASKTAVTRKRKLRNVSLPNKRRKLNLVDQLVSPNTSIVHRTLWS